MKLNKGLAKGIAKISLIVLVLAAFGIFVLNFVLPSFATEARIWTSDAEGNEKTDFEPGDLVYIHGEGFKPTSQVTITITRPNGQQDSGSVETNESGNFVYVYDLNGIEGEYLVKATDGTNSAQTSFTDYVSSLYVIYPNGGEIVSGTINVQFYVDAEGSPPTGTVYVYYRKDGCSGWVWNWNQIGSVSINGDGTYSIQWDTTTVVNDNDYCIGIWDGEFGSALDTDKSNSVFTVNNQVAVCGNGILEGNEQCESPFGPCCDSQTCQFKPAQTVCRPAAGDCDVAEYCTGSSAECPQDAKSPENTPCDNGLYCDGPDHCDGAGNCVNLGNPIDCDDQDDCTIDTCDEENDQCVNTFSDTEGPTTSNVLVIPSYNNGVFNVTAIAEDECSNIKTSEYFLRHGGSVDCGTPGSGTLMPAEDGNFDELIEELRKDSVEFFMDGSNRICIQSQDAANNWGNCVCGYFETDSRPPELVYNFELNDVPNPYELLVCGNDPTIEVTICDSQSDIQGGEYFLDKWIPPEPIPAPWSGFWLTPLNHYIREDGWHCSDLTAIVNLTPLSEGTHYINQIRGKDAVENWGKVYGQNFSYSFVKDTLAPSTTKTLIPAGGISRNCTEEEINEANLPQGVQLTDGCQFVKTGTQIVLHAEDPDPQQTGEHAGNTRIHYLVWYKVNPEDEWTLDQAGLGEPNQDVVINLVNDSYHLVKYWAVDACGWEEDPHYELDIVDTKAPKMWKEVGQPSKLVDPECNPQQEVCGYYMTQQTPITFKCVDQDPHPVGDVTMHIEVWWKLNEGDEFVLAHNFTQNQGEWNFTCHEDSIHKLVYWCEDALGNAGPTYEEVDYVDTQAPEMIKTIGEPKIEGYECVFDDDVELGQDGWTATGLWHITGYRSHSPTHSWAYNKESDHTYDTGMANSGELISPVITLGSSPQLSFWSWEKTECGGYCYYDRREVYVSEDGSVWNLVWNSSGPENNWHQVSIDLSAYAGKTVKIKFRFDTIDWFFNYYEGWYVDDIKVCNNTTAFWWVRNVTTITLDCDDSWDGQAPHPVDNEVICYRISFDDPQKPWLTTEYCDKFGGTMEGEWCCADVSGEINYTFTFQEESLHDLEYYCVDDLGNENTVDIEYFKVDDTPPKTTKTVGNPKYPGTEDVEWWITQNTKIILSCVDQDPHPVNDVTLYYRDYLDGIETLPPFTAVPGGYVEIKKNEDCKHVLEWYCVDALGNSEGSEEDPIVEVDQVDTEPPVIVKWVSDNTVKPGDVVTICANITDIKQTQDPGVGVNESTVWAELVLGFDPIWVKLNLVEGNTYCGNWTAPPITQFICGYKCLWKLYVKAADYLGNERTEDGLEIIVDNAKPIIQAVLWPSKDKYYRDGKKFEVKALAIDFGGDWNIYNWDNCKASGVKECRFYAIKYDFESVNQSEIKNLWDYLEWLEETTGEPIKVVYLGSVPWVNGYCQGTLQIPVESGLQHEDILFLAYEIEDNAGNVRSGLAEDWDGDKITMKMDQEGPSVVITGGNLPGPFKTGSLVQVFASIEDVDSGPKDCWADLYKCVGEEGCEETVDTGYNLEGYVYDFTCEISDSLPSGLASGDYQIVIVTTDNELNTGKSSWDYLVVDNSPPAIELLQPDDGPYDLLVPIEIRVTDQISPIVDDTVQYRVFEPPAWYSPLYCLFGSCPYDSSWITTTYNSTTGTYQDIFNATELEEGKTYFLSIRGCDVLYDPVLFTVNSVDQYHCAMR